MILRGKNNGLGFLRSSSVVVDDGFRGRNSSSWNNCVDERKRFFFSERQRSHGRIKRIMRNRYEAEEIIPSTVGAR